MMTHRPQQFPLARQSAGVAPPRRPGSIRRTTSIDSHWPDGASAAWTMAARARDLCTPEDGGDPHILSEAGYEMRISPAREILALKTSAQQERTGELVGVRAGGDSRRMIASALGDLVGTPLYQILDDFAGASLVARWIWSQWMPDWAAFSKDKTQPQTHGRKGNMLNICTGFAEGSSALLPDRLQDAATEDTARVGPLDDPSDSWSWHAMPDQHGPAMRRARRLDIWREDRLILVDAAFQDSGTAPDGGRRAVHEYRVYAEIDAESGILESLQALPLILPFPECPGAAVKAARMVGHQIGDFRNTVLDTLPSTLGCTHLNDVLRGLADVPVLAANLA